MSNPTSEVVANLSNVIPGRTVSPWYFPELEEPWTNVSALIGPEQTAELGIPDACYRIDQLAKKVEGKFMIGGGPSAANTVLWTFPEGLRPATSQTLGPILVTDLGDHVNPGGARVMSDGTVQIDKPFFLDPELGVILPEDGTFIIAGGFSFFLE